jgi:hypothetical protein
MTLRRIGPWSCAKVSGVLYAAAGLLIGIFFSLISLVAGSLAAAAGDDSGLFGALFGVGAIILLPIFYGAIGFVGGAIGAWLYNVVAGWVGGIEVEFDSGPTPPSQPMQS